ncbi:chemotaxis sensory transducer [Rhodopseudomonas palustris BisB5]|uniref:Chemotaxis sensory transducer n=1 Tax=Rhodopseudomonas palustris (strain BisB5) TaxID=316057 RepID=Q13EU6_RHOPS|nr:chemotaxis sensory transducer [Rhodopseudomonas palustris BisB5]
MARVSIRALSVAVFLGLALIVFLNLSSFFLYQGAQGEISEAQTSRYQSYLLADELRQSSDDLTRLVRTYVVTGDAKFEQQYWDVLAIRNGEKPRPDQYQRIYWDFMAADGRKPRPDGVNASLQQLMERGGFSAEEFGKLKQAQNNSNELIKLETIAMNAVKGRFEDRDGKFTKTGAPDTALARELVHSADYHKYKAQIMAPIDEFFVLLDRRTGANVAIAEAKAALYRTVSIVFLGLLLVSALVIGWVMLRGIARPLRSLSVSMNKLAEGDFNVALPGLDARNELGEVARAVERFKVKAEEKGQAEAEALLKQDQIAASQRRKDTHKLADDFEGAVGRIIDTVSSASSELESSAGKLTSTATRAQQLATLVAGASEEASTNVQSVASATEELSASVNEISRQVQDSARMASEAVDQARRTNDRVGELSKAAARIGDVVELINTIAGQTNLLALNATIEAARAGEAGRGFAVVASEVKALAEQTAKATGDIGQQISGIQAATQESVGAIKEISGTIERLSEISATIASAVEEQGAATLEISRNVQQAAQGTQRVSSNIADVQNGASETGSASSHVLSAAQSLSNDSNRLKQEVGRFLDSVRAA